MLHCAVCSQCVLVPFDRAIHDGLQTRGDVHGERRCTARTLRVRAPEQAGDARIHGVQHAARRRRRDPRLCQKALCLQVRTAQPRCLQRPPSSTLRPGRCALSGTTCRVWQGAASASSRRLRLGGARVGPGRSRPQRRRLGRMRAGSCGRTAGGPGGRPHPAPLPAAAPQSLRLHRWRRAAHLHTQERAHCNCCAVANWHRPAHCNSRAAVTMRTAHARRVHPQRINARPGKTTNGRGKSDSPAPGAASTHSTCHSAAVSIGSSPACGRVGSYSSGGGSGAPRPANSPSPAVSR